METNPNRHEKMREALREVAAEFLAREAGPQSLITVTSASLSSEGRRGTVFITVLPESAEAAALAFANRNRGEFGQFFEKRIRGVSVPRVEFALDRGEKSRQRLDDIPL
jgi:ribosome-binding factor A